MSVQAGFTLAVLLLTILALAREILSPDVLLFGALIVLTVARVVDLPTALAGFSNPALVTVAALFVVAGALRATGALSAATHAVLGTHRSIERTLGRLSGATAAVSAFVNNTPIVAVGVPEVTSWAKRQGVSPSRLLIPLSFASILGGLCTLIGTSTNLVTDGLLRARGLPGLGFFEISAVGVPCALLGVLYLALVAPRLLPDRTPIRVKGEDVRRYLVEMRLSSGSPLAGRSVEDAGLRHLPGLFLVRIERSTGVLSPVGPAERLLEGDRLTFAGVVETIVDLRRFRGLEPMATERPPEADASWELHEAVVSPGSPLVGTTIRDASFRSRFNAAVVAVHRHGERIESRIGDIVLRPGDTILLEAAPGFSRAFRDSTDFYLVSRVEGSSAPNTDRALRALLILAGVVALAAFRVLPVALAALLGGLATVVLRCQSYGEARRSVDWSVLVLIGSALGLARALDASGAAAWLGGGIVDVGHLFGTAGSLAAVYVGTLVLTTVVTNNAAAALMFPIVIAAAESQGLPARPLVIVMTVAASLSFATPVGYQTNLMVYGPGGYRFTDFTRVGLPLQLLLGFLTVLLVPLVWPLG